MGAVRTLLALLVWGPLSLPAAAFAAGGCGGWPEWESFRARFISEGGRVIDPSGPRQVTTSEGQSYALFFALVADDRPTFDRLLRWTGENLAGGDLTARLPAWQWGRRDDGTWGVLDANSASDADLWLAYTLGEAGRAWGDDRYLALAELLAARILREESADPGGLGPTLLPAPRGFHPEPDRWRLNPGYLPLQLLRGMAARYPDTGWPALADPAVELIVRSAPTGFAPDWIAYTPKRGFETDPVAGPVGSFDAIRVYLWAGMLAPGERERERVLSALRPMARHLSLHGTPPLEVETREGKAQGVGPIGFSAALLPFLTAAGLPEAARLQRLRIEAQSPSERGDNYYDRVLILFGAGWWEGRYRFSEEGGLTGCAK